MTTVIFSWGVSVLMALVAIMLMAMFVFLSAIAYDELRRYTAVRIIGKAVTLLVTAVIITTIVGTVTVFMHHAVFHDATSIQIKSR